MNYGLIKIFSITICSAVLFGCKTSADAISLTPVEEKTESVSETKNEKRSIFQKLKENNHLTVKETIGLYYKLKKESPNEYNFENEQELNRYG